MLIHKKKIKFDIEKYHPASIIPVLSKIYKGCRFNQIYSYFNQILSNISVDSEKVAALNLALFYVRKILKRVGR